MRTKKKTVEQEKNRNSQKSVKSDQLMGMGVYGGKDFWKKKLKRLSSVLRRKVPIGYNSAPQIRPKTTPSRGPIPKLHYTCLIPGPSDL